MTTTSTSWLLLLLVVVDVTGELLVLDTLVSAESLMRFWTFLIYFFSLSNVSQHGISSPPFECQLAWYLKPTLGKISENWQVPVTLHLTVP